MHPDLKDYLEKMICPPDGQILITSDLYSVPFGELEDCSYHGAIIVGEPTERQVEELLRILTPGAHIMIMGTEQSPTAFEGVCISEDAGFEVRDAIFVADDPERFKYASKASRKEREAGCAALPARKGHEAVEREEGSAGVANPRAGAGRTANEVRNFHPTVKSVEIMDWCMREVSPGDHVVEPFGGSGTTACVAPGRRVNLTAIELNEEGDYGAIIDARVRHWANNVHFVPGGVKITSEFESEVEVDDGPTDFFSLLTQDVQPRMEIMNREGEIEIILLEGDCVERMQEIPSNSVDWVITDPPYGLKFMNKGFDNLGEGSQQREWHRRWLEQAFRILKPGCQIKAFCGTRTQHHLLKAMSEVGFEGVGADTVDSEAWIYGCLSDDSEIWTESGWRLGTEIAVGDVVGCWDFETGAFSMSPVQEVFLAPYEGEMVSIHKSGISQLLTPNHRVYHHLPEFPQMKWTASDWRCDQADDLPITVRVPIIVESSETTPFQGTVMVAEATVGTVQYEGNVWCVRVPTGAFIARREGKVFITGNSGFPKSLNVSKEIDRILGEEREIVGYKLGVGGENLNDLVRGSDSVRTTDDEGGKGVGAYGVGAKQVRVEVPITAPASDEAKKWEGWGTALKPAWEPICCGRKPE